MIIAILLSLSIAGQTAEAETDGWDMTSDPARRSTIASAAWSSGQAILIRCQAGRLDVIVNGFDPSEGGARLVEMTLGDIGPESQPWAATPGRAFASPPEPARIARLLTNGGELRLRTKTKEGQEGRTYALPLPTNGDGVREVLRNCNQPLHDEHDRLPRLTGDAITWRRTPTPVAPSEAVSGEASVGCIVDTSGRPASCWIESESPTGKGIGAAGLATARTGLLTVPDDERDGVRVIRFTTRFEFN